MGSHHTRKGNSVLFEEGNNSCILGFIAVLFILNATPMLRRLTRKINQTVLEDLVIDLKV